MNRMGINKNWNQRKKSHRFKFVMKCNGVNCETIKDWLAYKTRLINIIPVRNDGTQRISPIPPHESNVTVAKVNHQLVINKLEDDDYDD